MSEACGLCREATDVTSTFDGMYFKYPYQIQNSVWPQFALVSILKGPCALLLSQFSAVKLLV